MKKEQFLECRAELLKILETYNVEKGEAPGLCASLLNEYLVELRYGATIRLTPLAFSEDGYKT